MRVNEGWGRISFRSRAASKSHCANRLQPTLREKRAKDGAPAVWLCQRKACHPPHSENFCRSSVLHDREHGPHDGIAARSSADEPVRRARAADGAALRRSGNAAAVSGRRQESAQRAHLSDERKERYGSERIVADEFLPTGCG